MGDLGRRGSRKRKDASQVSGAHPSLMLDPESLPVLNCQNHLNQRTLFDNFLVTRKSIPAPTITNPDSLRDGELKSPAVIFEATGTVHYPHASDFLETSSVEHVDDMAHINSSPRGSSVQNTAGDDIGALTNK